MKNGLSTAGKVGAIAIGAITSAASAMVGAIGGAANATADYGDTVDKMSQKMGLTAEAYQEWDAVMQHSGTSMETMKASMKTLANAAENGNEAFSRLGITQEQLANMNQQEIFEATIAGLQNVTDDTERTYLAGQLLGRGATELGALLNTSAEDTQAMRDEVHALGGVMSDEAVKAAARYKDSLQDMTTAFSGLKRNLTADFMPAMATVMDGLGKVFSGQDGGIELISQGVNDFIEQLNATLPKMLETGTQIVKVLFSAIVENLPAIVDAGVDVIVSLTEGIIENLPAIFESAVEILLALVDSLTENLPVLIPAAVSAVLQIVTALTEPDTLVNLIDAALQLILALTQGLVDAIPQLIEAAPVIIGNLVKAIIAAFPQIISAGVQLIGSLVKGIGSAFSALGSVGRDIVSKVGEAIKGALKGALNWGKDLVSNFIDGIKQGWQNLKKGVSDVAAGIAGFFHHSVPKYGPFKDELTWMPDFMQNMADGIRDNAYLVTDEMDKAFNFDSGIITGSPEITATVSGASATDTLLNQILSALGEMGVYIDGEKAGRLMAKGANVGMGQAYISTARRALA